MLSTMGTLDQVSSAGTMHDICGSSPDTSMLFDHECCAILGRDLSGETKTPDSARSTIHDVKDATLQRADHIDQRSRAETHRVMSNDSSNDNVANGLDFDDPPDYNLDDEARHLDQLIAAGWKAINSQALSISFTDTSNEAPGVNATASTLKRASGSEMNDKEIKISRYKCRDSHLNRSLHFDCSHTARPPGAAAA